MPKYTLKMITTNTYEQTMIEVVEGKADTPKEFLELCWQFLEENADNTGLSIKKNEPDNFSCSGGFCSNSRDWSFYEENGVSHKDLLLKLGWW